MLFLKMKTFFTILALLIDFGVKSSVLREDRKKRLQEEVNGGQLKIAPIPKLRNLPS